MNPVSLEDIKTRTDLLPGDLGYIAYMHGIIYAKEYSFGLDFESYVFKGLHEFTAKYNAEKDRVWICEHEHSIVGFLMAINWEDTFQLRYFVLHPDYRNIGLGKWLVGQFVSYVKEMGCTKSFLWTTNEQHAAISLYERYGFQLTEEKESTAFGRPLTELRYDLEL